MKTAEYVSKPIISSHLITIKSSEESRFQINDSKPKKQGYYNRQWTKTVRALGIKAVLGRMTDLRKKNCSVHCATNNWMIVLGDGKSRGGCCLVIICMLI